jgi:hypothetical protein
MYVSDWVARTRGYILNGLQEERNKLASAYTKGSDTLTFTYPLGGIQPGARISAGLNTFYVWAVTGNTATVSAGEDGATDQDLDADTIVRVRPRFTDHEILDVLNDDLRDLSSPYNGLYAMSEFEFTYQSAFTGFDLDATDLISVYEVRYEDVGSMKTWPRLSTNDFRVVQNAPTSDFPSGNALFIYGSAQSGNAVRVLYKGNFTTLNSLSSGVRLSGLPDSAWDLPPMGAAVKLMASREIKRNLTESQGDTRRASEVQAGAVANSYRGLAAIRASRIAAERARLDAQYPTLKDN